jgi:SHS2 domain-containing protein
VSEIVANAGSLRQGFVQAGLAVFAMATDPTLVEPLEVREVRAHGASLEALLAGWIAECCYVHEIEGFVCHAIDLDVFEVEPRAGGEPLRLHAFLHGEETDPARHRSISIAPSGLASIRPTSGGYELRLPMKP